MTVIYGRIVGSDGVRHGYIEFDKIIRKCEYTDIPPINARVFSDDYLIFPGFIDLHAHCREDIESRLYSECYLTAGTAALNGGITFLCDMPDVFYSATSIADYQKKQKLTRSCPIDVLLYSTISNCTTPFGKSIPYAIISPHDVTPEILERYRDECVDIKCTHLIQYIKPNPNLKISSVATEQDLELLQEFDNVEISPQYLYFDAESLTAENKNFSRTIPPLQNKQQVDNLLKLLSNGRFKYLVSDHTPYSIADKMNGIAGLPNLDTFGAIIAWLIICKNVDPVTIFNMACYNPGQWVRRFVDKNIGELKPNYEASITVLNLKKPMSESRGIYSRCGWSLFDLRSLPGSVEVVYYKGERVVDGDFIKV